jgi:CRISPR/Cas system CMR subunit Cmr6 (Cas7 group RAMP superfamily)
MMPAEPPLGAAGPFRAVIQLVGDRLARELGPDANALVMLNRVAFLDTRGNRPLKLEEKGKRALLGWACRSSLGQDASLVRAVGRRREHALRVLSGTPAAGPGASKGTLCYLRLRAEPEWRLAVGHGNKANAYETGLALHGTYGWPVIPGSALKGLSAAWAASESSGADAGDLLRVLGGPRPRTPLSRGGPASSGSVSPGPGARQGTVRFLDAIPDGEPVTVLGDVLTPHVKPYYDSLASRSAVPVPPGEYHNPVPVTFLTVRGGYAVDLYGPDEKDVALAAEWLMKAGEEFGAGAKTAAGYGYLALTPKRQTS